MTSDLAHELRRVEALADERLVEVDDEVGASVVDRADDHTGRLLLPAQSIREITQLAPLHRPRLDEDDVALTLDDREVRGSGGLRLAQLLAQRLELAAKFVRLEPRTVEVRVRLAGRNSLDPARARADRAFREDRERADLRGPAHMRPSAQLTRVAGNLDHADLVAVLLAEEHHRPKLARFLDGRHECVHRQVLEDLLVHAAFDLGALLAGELVGMCEVEAQLVRPNGGPSLTDVVAEHVLQRLVQEMGGRVVGHGRKAMRPGDDRAHAITVVKATAFEHEHLVVSFEADCLAQCRLGPRLLVDEVAGVRDLAAARRVERRLVQLYFEAAVTAVVERRDRRQDVCLLVSDELRLRPFDLKLDRNRSARPLPLLLHQRRELVLVDAEPALARKLLGQLERKAVRVVEAERVLARDVAALLCHLLEEAQAARERLAEPLLLGREDAMDLVAVVF